MIRIILALLPLIAEVESNFDPTAVGDNGKALGMYQIHKAYWQDGQGFLKTDWDYKTYATNEIASTYIVIGYLYRYGRHYEKKTGQPVTMEVLARIHNGGPHGYKKKATEKYWRKIERLIDE